jgi:pimeloyl-ACP methyl ester carboxylesterase
MQSTQTHALPYPKSTNGRTIPSCPAPFRFGFQTLSRICPSQTEHLAAWLFCHPMRGKVAPEEQAVLDGGHAFTLNACGHDLAAWSWGDGPTVLLHHGWNGRAAHMTGFVRPLLDAGYSVVTYDAPAHGESPGRITAMPEMARVLREVAFRLGGIHGVVAHSVGGAATLLAIRNGLKLDRAVLLAPPSDMRGFIDLFGEHIGLPQRSQQGMARRAAAWFGIDWRQMEVAHWAEGDRPPVLVFHDRGDRVVPWGHGERIRAVWGRAELITTEGLGHRRVRRDDDVIRRAVSFLGSALPGRGTPDTLRR